VRAGYKRLKKLVGKGFITLRKGVLSYFWGGVWGINRYKKKTGNPSREGRESRKPTLKIQKRCYCRSINREESKNPRGDEK